MRFFTSLRFAQNDNYLEYIGKWACCFAATIIFLIHKNTVICCHSERSEACLQIRQESQKIFRLLVILFICIFFFFPKSEGQQVKTEPATSTIRDAGKKETWLSVAAVQMRSSTNLAENSARISAFIEKCASEGARVVVFPECALSGYDEKSIKSLDAEQIADAEKKVAETCRKASVYAIFGLPWRDGSKLFNSASVITPGGKVIERYHKIQLAEGWPDQGDHLSVFPVDSILCSIIICHDERYPELVRLPVLAGAKVIFYVSHESGVREETKIEPYRAQIQARAVENNVFIVQSNAPANPDGTGSHGQSRIIAPDGNIIKEALIYSEEVISARLDINKASRGNATKSLTRGILGDWWREGLRSVRIIKD